MADDAARKVLVGRVYAHMSNTWTEWADKTFDEVCTEMAGRRGEQKPNTIPDEVIEVIIVRRARISSDVTVQEVEV